jgi:colicin import membrane protein
MRRNVSVKTVERRSNGLFLTIVISAVFHLVLFVFLGYRITKEKEEMVVFTPPYSVSLVSGDEPGEGGDYGTEPSQPAVDEAAPVKTDTNEIPAPTETKKPEKKKETTGEVNKETNETAPSKEKETTTDLNSAIEKIKKKISMEEAQKKKEKEKKELAEKEKDKDNDNEGKRPPGPPHPPPGRTGEDRTPPPGKPGGGNPYGYDNVVAVGGSGKGVPNAEFSAYYSKVWKQIRSMWAMPEGLKGTGLVAVYGIRIGRDGRVIDAWLENGSGNSAFDDSALRAIHKADPLPPLPETYSDITMDVGIRFYSDRQ